MDKPTTEDIDNILLNINVRLPEVLHALLDRIEYLEEEIKKN